MLTLFILYAPCFICCMGVVVFATKADKKHTDYIALIFSVCAAIYFFAEVQYVFENCDYKTYVVADVISQFARPLCPPLSLILCMLLIGQKPCTWYIVLSVGLSVMFGVVSCTVCFIFGMDEAAEFLDNRDSVLNESVYMKRMHYIYRCVCIYCYQVIFVIQALTGFAYTYWMCRKTHFRLSEIPDFLFKGRELEPAHLLVWGFSAIYVLSLCKLAIGRPFYIHNQWFSVCFALVRTLIMGLVCRVLFLSREASVTLYILRGGSMACNCDDQAADEMTEDARDITMVRMAERIEEMMDRESLFLLNPFSVDDMARKLGTNHSYVSAAVNSRFKMSFTRYVSQKRLNYAMEYMRSHRDAQMCDVALQSGFSNTSSMDKAFKYFMSITPRMWILKMDLTHSVP